MHGVSQKAIDGGYIKGAANVPSVVEVTCVYQLPSGKMGRNRFHGAYATVPANFQTLATALWTSLSAAWTSHLQALMAADTSMVRVEVRDMTDAKLAVYIGTGTALVGSAPGDAMPSQNAIVMTENVTVRGRGAKGRAFLAGWAVDADAGGGAIAAAAKTAVDGYGTSVFAALTAQNLTPCVAKPARQAYTGLAGTEILERAADHVNVTSYTCNNLVWDTQRRRA